MDCFFRVSLFSLDQRFADRREKYENFVSPGSRVVESSCFLVGSTPLADFCVSLAGVGRLIAEARVTPIVVPFWHEGKNSNPFLTTFFISSTEVHCAHGIFLVQFKMAVILILIYIQTECTYNFTSSYIANCQGSVLQLHMNVLKL